MSKFPKRPAKKGPKSKEEVKLSYFGRWSKQESDKFLLNLTRQLFADLSSSCFEQFSEFLIGVHYSLCRTPIDVRGATLQLVELCSSVSVDYSSISLDDAFILRQILAVWSKNADFKIVDTKAVAVRKFLDSEYHCRRVNARYISNNYSFWGKSSDVDQVLYLAQRKIAVWLDDVPSIADLQCAFGPGNNTTVKMKTHPRYKLSGKPVCSSDMLSIIDDVLATIPAWSAAFDGAYQVDCGQHGTVPKSAKEDRNIITEPTLNTYVQKGIGRLIRERLKLVGCDLNDQSINQSLAEIASVCDHLVTLDLASASDNISIAVVCFLLPVKWVDLLSKFRTGAITLKRGKEKGKLELEKFSSMGNGFTFELESLIFFALASAVCEFRSHQITPHKQPQPQVDYSIYGDDIIVPVECCSLTVEVLEHLGFVINKSKSFVSGPFRESCGGDYLNGTNIRPFYFKDRMSYARLVGFLNHDRHSHLLSRDYRRELIQSIPEDLLFYGPEGYGDGHLHTDADLGQFTDLKRDRGWSGYTFKTHIQKPRRTNPKTDPKYLEVGDSLIPTYEQSLKIPGTTISGVDWCTYRDVIGLEFTTTYAVFDMKDVLKASYSKLSKKDPYVIRGSYGEKVVNIYTLVK